MTEEAAGGTTDPTSPGLRTPSLRRRVTVVVLALIGVMLVVLVVATDLALESRLDSQLRERLVDRAGIATALVDQVDGRDLARRLEGDGVSVVVTSADGEVYAEGPLAGAASGVAASSSSPGAAGAPVDPATPAPEGPQTPGDPGGRGGPAGPGPEAVPAPKDAGATITEDGDLLSVTRDLADGSSVLLVADAGDIAATVAQVRVTLLVAALLVLLVAAAAVPLVVRRALRPLEQITGVARSITRGDRDQRLNPLQPTSELGRTAVAFDDMLDAVVGAEQRAVGSEERLRDFLSDAAHELRTPLTGVQAAAEHLLRDDPDRADRESVVLGLIRETRRAGRLVDDMLLMTRIDGGLTLDRAEVDLRAVADEVVDQRALVHPGITLQVTDAQVTDPQVTDAQVTDARVTADRDRLVQVVGNLVDNAVQARADRITVRVGRDADQVWVDVDDDGPGVPAADRERIFERLVRLDGSRSARRGGAGLGLPIARGLVRAHGGDLVCLGPGPEGTGTRFRLTLPAGQPAHDHPGR